MIVLFFTSQKKCRCPLHCILRTYVRMIVLRRGCCIDGWTPSRGKEVCSEYGAKQVVLGEPTRAANSGLADHEISLTVRDDADVAAAT